LKVYADKLPGALKKGPVPVYMVSGDEPLLVQEACDLVRASLKSRGFAERELFHVEASFDWNGPLYSAGSMSLFAEQKLIEVRMPGGKPGDQGSKALVELVGQLGGETVLMLVLPRLDAAAQRAKWFKTLDSIGLFVQIWPIDAKELPRWLEGRFRQAGLKATRDAVIAMAERVEGNLLAAVQEIERLRLSSQNQQVDVQQVIEGVADSARYDVFRLLDAAMAGDLVRAVRMSDGLKSEGVELLFVVNMLARELRSLESMKTEIRAGKNPREVLKQHRVWDKRASLVNRCLERHSVRALRDLQESLGTVDRMVKGIVQGDPWRELQNLLLALAGQETVRRVSSLP
jgi:DNA polymerase-3 subunit delta